MLLLEPCALSFQWRYNGHDSVSNHQPYDCLLNRLSKKISKLPVTVLCVGNSPGIGESPHKWPVTRKMFPFDDVIMILRHNQWLYRHLWKYSPCNKQLQHVLLNRKRFACSKLCILMVRLIIILNAWSIVTVVVQQNKWANVKLYHLRARLVSKLHTDFLKWPLILRKFTRD